MMNSTIMTTGNTVLIEYLYGALLVLAGAYQFTPLKRICIGYCESPMSFFMRRWRDGTSGAVNMGLYHGIYCPWLLLGVLSSYGSSWMDEFTLDGSICWNNLWRKDLV